MTASEDDAGAGMDATVVEHQLLDFDDDVLLVIAQMLFDAREIVALLRLAATCGHLRTMLLGFTQAFEPKWCPALTDGGDLQDDHSCFCGSSNFHALLKAWAASNLLPDRGRWAWEVQLRCQHRIMQGSNTTGATVHVGICDDGNCYAWAVRPFYEALRRFGKDSNGFCGDASERGQDPPHAFAKVLTSNLRLIASHNQTGNAAWWPGRHGCYFGPACANATVRCIWDADAGTLSFQVNGGQAFPAFNSFPRGVRVRRWGHVTNLGDVLKMGPVVPVA